MRKIDYFKQKRDILSVLTDRPIWVSDLHRVHGLPQCHLNGTRIDRNASKALIDLIKEGKVEIVTESRKTRKQIMLSRGFLRRHCLKILLYLTNRLK